jgi:hypothetical protein
LVQKRNQTVHKKSIPVVAGLLMLSASAAQSAVVFDNFGPGDSYDSSIGWTISTEIIQGMGFSPVSAGFLASIDIAAGTTGSPPTPYTLTLRADDAGVPGLVLETLNFPVTTSFGTNNAPTTAAAAGTTLLSPGTLYWLVASSPTGVNVPWHHNSTDDTGPRAFSVNGAPWVATTSPRGAFRVTVAQAPEPTTLALLGMGFAGLGFAGKRLKAKA